MALTPNRVSAKSSLCVPNQRLTMRKYHTTKIKKEGGAKTKVVCTAHKRNIC